MRYLSATFLVLAMISTASAANLGNVYETPIKDDAHVGQNPGTPDSRQGGETIDDAFIITGLPFNDAGNTVNNINDYDEACPYTSSISPDVVYSFTPNQEMIINIDLCTSGYDTKVYVYENVVTPGAPYACNDDYAGCIEIYRSMIPTLSLTPGNIYYIVVDGYGGDAGDYTLDIFEFIHCGVECGDAPLEGEPELVDGYDDQYNGGCNSNPAAPLMQVLEGDENGEATLCGISGWFLSPEGDEFRDTDWFEVTAGEEGYITFTCISDYTVYMFVLSTTCNGTEVLHQVLIESMVEGTIEFAQDPGTIAWLWVGPNVFTGPVYEFTYLIGLSGIEGSAPSATEDLNWGGMKSMFK